MGRVSFFEYQRLAITLSTTALPLPRKRPLTGSGLTTPHSSNTNGAPNVLSSEVKQNRTRRTEQNSWGHRNACMCTFSVLPSGTDAELRSKRHREAQLACLLASPSPFQTCPYPDRLLLVTQAVPLFPLHISRGSFTWLGWLHLISLWPGLGPVAPSSTRDAVAGRMHFSHQPPPETASCRCRGSLSPPLPSPHRLAGLTPTSASKSSTRILALRILALPLFGRSSSTNSCTAQRPGRAPPSPSQCTKWSLPVAPRPASALLWYFLAAFIRLCSQSILLSVIPHPLRSPHLA